MESKLLFLDVETTGTDEKRSHIYQLSGMIEINGKCVEDFDLYMNPGKHTFIEDAVMGMLDDRNLSIKQLLEFQSSSKAFIQFLTIIQKYLSITDSQDKFTVCAYNAHFDFRFLFAWFIQNGTRFLNYFHTGTLDVMVLATYALRSHRHNISSMSLTSICNLFDIPLNAHDSKEDIEATYKLYKGLEGIIVNITEF